jgi:hypothetical protein
MKTFKSILYYLFYIIIHRTNNYLWLSINYTELKYVEYKVYQYYKFLLIFNIRIKIDEGNSIKNDYVRIYNWLFDINYIHFRKIKEQFINKIKK